MKYKTPIIGNLWMTPYYLILFKEDFFLFKYINKVKNIVFSGWDWFIRKALYMWIVSGNVTKPT